MGNNLKAVLLTVLTLSAFTVAIIELTGISSTAIFNKYKPASVVNVSGRTEDAVPAFTDPNAERMKQVSAMPKTTMQFYETKHDFGKVKEGTKLRYPFKLKNTGDQPLLIAKTDVSCGCTVTDFSKAPILPGADGEITVQFNTSGKSGVQKKNIIVHTNAQPEAVSISIEANVD